MSRSIVHDEDNVTTPTPTLPKNVQETDVELTPDELRERVQTYASDLLIEFEAELGGLTLSRINWRVSRRLFHAGGYCNSYMEEPPRHEIVLSYPAYVHWGWQRTSAIVRHELVHAAVHDEYGADAQAHGAEFRELADRIGAPLRGERPLPYRFELSCSACERFVDGLYEPSPRTREPTRFRTSCCNAPLEVDEGEYLQRNPETT